MNIKHVNRSLGIVKCIGLCEVRKNLNLEITGSAPGIVLSVFDGVCVEASCGDCVTLRGLFCHYESFRRGITILGS